MYKSNGRETSPAITKAISQHVSTSLDRFKMRFQSMVDRSRKAQRKTSGCLRGCFFKFALGVLVIILGCIGLAFALVLHVSGAQQTQSRCVLLLIDHSLSMYEKGGLGSDPDLLRLEAARLFISFLGVDAGRADHQLGVINFGGHAELLLPLTPLGDDIQRAEISMLLNDPPRMGWTNPNEALQLGIKQFDDSNLPAECPVLVLLTDGKPEWSSGPTMPETSTYIADTRKLGEQINAAGIPLFVILLANQATDADEEIANLWQPLWGELAAQVDPGAFYEARSADDLLSIYHDIALMLVGGQTSGAVIDRNLDQSKVLETIDVEKGLERLTLVIYRSDPQTDVIVWLPDGTELDPDQSGVSFIRDVAGGRNLIWAIESPQPGLWMVEMNGQGRVIVWKDWKVKPLTPTPQPTKTVLFSPSPVPAPVIHVDGLPEVALVGDQLTVSISVENGMNTNLQAVLTGPEGVEEPFPVADDGHFGDRVAGDGIYGLTFLPDEAGLFSLTIALIFRDGKPIIWSGRVMVDEKPDLVVLSPKSGTRIRPGSEINVEVMWMSHGKVVEGVRTKTMVASMDSKDSVALQMDDERKFVGQLVAPEKEGDTWLSIKGEGETPSGASVKLEKRLSVMVKKPGPWGWVALLVLAILGTTLSFRVWWMRRPRLSGSLSVFIAPGGYTGPLKIDLDILGKGKFSIPEWPGMCLRPGAQIDESGGYQPEIEPAEGILLNGRKLNNPTLLEDGDHVSVNASEETGWPLEIVYENLLLRSDRGLFRTQLNYGGMQ